ncbi:MAG: AraC family transcriptional regulator, partial [Burkholderiaceae bacterium]|nr:AraC family transcriptional regulator [Burkholderiaceae bacterium]
MSASTRIALLSFDGFNELDCFIALGLLNRLRPLGWSAELCGPGHSVSSMNGVSVQLQRPLEWANEAEVVLFGAGLYTRSLAQNSALLDRLQLDPLRQLIG